MRFRVVEWTRNEWPLEILRCRIDQPTPAVILREECIGLARTGEDYLAMQYTAARK